MNTLEPRIYVACLSAYNEGYLHGIWIDAAQDTESLQRDIQTMLAASPVLFAEEWAIHAYEDFGALCLEESTDFEKIAEFVKFIQEYGELGSEVASYFGGDISYARQLMEDYYHGDYESETDFAECFTEEIMEIPEHLAFYIDYEKMARDLFINDFFSIRLNCKTHVFSYF